MPPRIGIIPAAGFGTRLLPASKSLPKEMLPLVDRPLLHHIVEEAVASGIDRLIIVISGNKQSLEDYFKPEPILERVLAKKSRSHLLETINQLARQVDLVFVRQEEQLGLGHAILTAQSAVGDAPFSVFLPDDIIVNRDKPAMLQMLEIFERYQNTVIGVEEMPRENLSHYGVIDPIPVEDYVYRVERLVEKPSPEAAPSLLGIVGRYVFPPHIFSYLARTPVGSGGEIELTDAITLQATDHPIYAYQFDGIRYDTGNILGLLKANIALGLDRPDLGPPLQKWLAHLGFNRASE